MKTQIEQYRGMHTAMVAAMGLKKGDTVKVLYKPENFLGWNDTWIPAMDKFIGTEDVVRSITDSKVILSSHNWPIFALQKVKDGSFNTFKISEDYTAEVKDGVVTVGCQTIPYDLLKEIYDCATKQLRK